MTTTKKQWWSWKRRRGGRNDVQNRNTESRGTRVKSGRGLRCEGIGARNRMGQQSGITDVVADGAGRRELRRMQKRAAGPGTWGFAKIYIALAAVAMFAFTIAGRRSNCNCTPASTAASLPVPRSYPYVLPARYRYARWLSAWLCWRHHWGSECSLPPLGPSWDPKYRGSARVLE